ncbi:MAG: rRNA maturation RNAse YbeY [Clostridia bacterium]|jgi:probable rRNA maturation factor|nr:rRNA maturation RNAse YbeY [Clostridia bacterium]
MERVQIEYLEVEENVEYDKLIKKVVKECFSTERLEKTKLYISIILTNPENIRKLNNEHRNIDKETDVLSFPMFEKEELEVAKKSEYEEILRRYSNISR